MNEELCEWCVDGEYFNSRGEGNRCMACKGTSLKRFYPVWLKEERFRKTGIYYLLCAVQGHHRAKPLLDAVSELIDEAEWT